MRSFHTVSMGVLVALTIALPARAGEAGTWEELAFLPWGGGDGELGRRPIRGEELEWGPHGLALSPAGEVAIVDRVNGRALLLDARGRVVGEREVGERAGPAALLLDGTLAVLDEGARRRVDVRGADEQVVWSPRWAMPPHRLVSWTPDGGAPVLEAMDAFQLRQPLSPASAPLAPRELPRGVPAADGRASTWVTLDGDRFVVSFDGEAVDFGGWDGLAGSTYPLASVEVLATDGDTAVLVLEAASTGSGPMDVDRLLAVVDREGRIGPPVAAPTAGTMRIPGDLAALADGTVVTLVAGEDGCRLWGTRVPVPGEGVDR